MPAIVLILVIILSVFLLFLLAISSYFFRLAIGRKNADFLLQSPDLAEYASGEPVFDTNWIEAKSLEDVEIKSYDGLLLRGYYLPAPVPTPKTVILAHGYTSRSKPYMSAFAEIYHERYGYNVLLVDDRGHGESEGRYIGFGWLDRLDFLKWIAYLINRLGTDAQIVLHGISMGGATVLMTGGEALPDNVKCIVSDCAYTSVKDILEYQLRRMYKLPPFPLAYLTSLICKVRAGYFFGEASALEQVRRCAKPVLFIHGADDTFVPASMLEPLYEAAPGYKEKELYPNSGHGLSFANHQAAYTERVEAFLQRFVS